ncbi:cysteine synthase A [Lentzea fradiae]|uniref:N-(2-amino-2-carboxyethyl)-L-glutamate synthase n=1 Tax=Lentzea fradiae TaxID=200378 RepID=A0A1G8CTM2_9PSEU|nr:2,3-diaminopropionate biosynthesis protein SbnA [Lentzea fradiae]SDH48825.1 cysteine synthase A [Lentzea fradiae]
MFESYADVGGGTPLVRLKRLFAGHDVDVLAKLEFLNPGGSIKDRPARHVVRQWLRQGVLRPGMRVVESTSGNFGVALAAQARAHDLACTLVVDPLVRPLNLALMRQHGAEVVQVDRKDSQGGYLHTRLAEVHRILAADPRAVWVNQYANPLNWQAHYEGTGEELVADLPGPPDHLVVALSTGGSLMGTARRLRESYPDVEVVAVDAVGSVIFGGPAGPRRIPGIGASRRPELLDTDLVDRVVHVTDDESAAGCHDLLAAESIMAGGSSGSVVAAIRKLLPRLRPGARVVTLFPDRGERYFDVIYQADPVVEPLHAHLIG